MGAYVGQVGSCFGFGPELAPESFTAQCGRKVVLLLRGCAELQHGGPTHLERQRERRRGQLEVLCLFLEDQVGVGWQILSAVRRGPGQSCQRCVEQRSLVGPGHLDFRVLLACLAFR